MRVVTDSVDDNLTSLPTMIMMMMMMYIHTCRRFLRY